ncbi:hypothetical protein F2Q68_00004594 [Brassica cretica]|uniref:Uncharacterized protein n=1 Tax=Brassica cretica TaxID=69181 RepID=A0A8S9JD21_BRACR|nr:hypothetical protein F2Q68_00004594 [Brassica cretica]
MGSSSTYLIVLSLKEGSTLGISAKENKDPTIENRETPSLLLRDLLNWELSAERVQMACFYASTHKLLLRKHQSSRLHRLAPPSPRRHQKPRASPSLARSQRFNSARPRSGIGELVLPRVQSVAPA